MIRKTQIRISSNVDTNKLSEVLNLLERNGIKVDETDLSFEYDTDNTKQNELLSSIFEKLQDKETTYENNNS